MIITCQSSIVISNNRRNDKINNAATNNIRTNIKLGIEIYKQLNNFDRYYIHTIINENSTKSN